MKTAYFILGMHRSGTSALGATLDSLGLEFGESLLEASKNNPMGYYENTAVQAFNESFLTGLGYSWDDCNFEVEKLPSSVFNEAVMGAKRILKTEFDLFEHFAIKDPRICLLFPIWKKACVELNIRLKVILAYRNPLEVAKSLKVRNQFEYKKSFLLWFQHMAMAEIYSRDCDRTLVYFEKLVHQYDSAVAELVNFLGMSGENVGSVEKKVSKELKHHEADVGQLAELPSFIDAVVKEYESGGLDNSIIDSAYFELLQLRAYFDNSQKRELFLQVFDERKKYKGLKDDFFKKLELSKEKVELLGDTVSKLEVDNARVRAELKESSQNKYDLNRVIKELQAKHNDTNLAILDIKGKLQNTEFELKQRNQKYQDTHDNLVARNEKLKNLQTLHDAQAGELSALLKEKESLNSRLSSANRAYEKVTEERDSIVQERDLVVQERDLVVQERDLLVQEHDSVVQEHDSVVKERDSVIQERDSVIQERDSVIQERDLVVQELDMVVQEYDSIVQARDALAQERDSAVKSREAAYETLQHERKRASEYQETLLVEKQTIAQNYENALIFQRELESQVKGLQQENTGLETQTNGLKEEAERLAKERRQFKDETLKLTQQSNKLRKENKKAVLRFKADKEVIKSNMRAKHDEKIKLLDSLLAIEKTSANYGHKNYQKYLRIYRKHSNALEQRLQLLAHRCRGLMGVFFSALYSGRFSVLLQNISELNQKFSRIPFRFIQNFDEQAYIEMNEDIEVAVSNGDFESGMEHFILHGYDEAFRGLRKIHKKRRIYQFQPEGDRDAQHDFTSFLAEFYEFKKEELNARHSSVDENESVAAIQQEKVTLTTSPAELKAPQCKAPAPNYLNLLGDKKSVAIDIILPVYNALDDVKNCINSLYNCQTLAFNLIVIDDCSEDETRLYLESESKSKGFELLRNTENKRFTKTVNRGFSVSTGDYVILLNSDTIVTPYWLEKLLLCFQSDDKTGIVGPLSNAASWQTVPVREDKVNGGWLVNEIPDGYTVDLMAKLVETVSQRRYPSVPSVNGFCYAIKRQVIDKIGTLDEEYFPTGYGEEDDFSIRAQAEGFNIRVADDTYVFHAKSKSYTKEVRKVLTVGGRKSLDKKHGKDRIEALIASWKAEPFLPECGDRIHRFMHVSSGKNKVVYTAIFGDYDTIKEPEYINEDWDYVCFTDNPNLTSDVFTIKHVDRIFDNVTKNARMIKLLSHIFLIGYEYSLWIDGSVKLRGKNINDLVVHNLSDNYISLHQHVKRDCVYQEEEACVLAGKDVPDTMKQQVAYYKEQGMPEEFGLFETAELARRQWSLEVQSLNMLWWQQLDKFSIRDQISLPFVFWKHGFKNSFMAGNQWLDAYFHMYKHANNHTFKEVPVDVVLLDSGAVSSVASRVRNILETTQYSDFNLTVVQYGESAEVDTQEALAGTEFSGKLTVQHSALTNPVAIANEAIKGARNPWVCVLDDTAHCFNSDWLTNMVSEISKEPKATILGPTVLDTDFQFLASGIKFRKRNGKTVDFYNSKKLGGTGNVAALHESCLLISKSHFHKLGGFDVSLNCAKSAVVDFCIRNNSANQLNRFVLNAEVIATEIDVDKGAKQKVLSKC